MAIRAPDGANNNDNNALTRQQEMSLIFRLTVLIMVGLDTMRWQSRSVSCLFQCSKKYVLDYVLYCAQGISINNFEQYIEQFKPVTFTDPKVQSIT